MPLSLPSELLTVAELSRADALAVEAGVPSLALMEAAGRSVVTEIRRRWARRPVTVLCGPGNNGGDGLVVARLLKASGWPVRLALLGDQAQLRGDAAANAARWDGAVEPLAVDVLESCELVVDALFGAGLTRPLAGVALELVAEINRRQLACIAIDIPSGVDGDSGAIRGAAPQAVSTVTFFRRKPGHLLLPGRQSCGDLSVADIGIPASVLDRIAPANQANGPPIWGDCLPSPQLTDHKYRRGHATIAGGTAMTGAARLAARGARRVGAGMVTIAAPSVAWPLYAAGDPGNLVEVMDDHAAWEQILGRKKRNAVLVGPGNGVNQLTRQRVVSALRSELAVVLDADALTVFEDQAADLFGWIKGPCVLTPHQGEFDRLFGIAGGDRLTRCRAATRHSGAIVVLKGADTVIAAPDGRILINDSAPPTLATAGSGDVLAGMITGLLAQGMAAFEAAGAAVWLHGRAAARFGPGLIAEDIADNLPAALAELPSVN